MRDESFTCFIDEFGEATQIIPVDKQTIEKWQGRLPEQLLYYWQVEGQNIYQDGLVSLVDPEYYEDLLKSWLKDTEVEGHDVFHVFARSGFGKLFVCGENNGHALTISCYTGCITFNKKQHKNQYDKARYIRNFFASADFPNYDLKDERNRPLFRQAVNLFGPLSTQEVFAFEPLLFLGGSVNIHHIKKQNIQDYLNRALEQITERQVVVIAP